MQNERPVVGKMSEPGTFETCRRTLKRSADGGGPEVAQDGGFVAYGPRLVQIFGELVTRRLVKLLRGTTAADVPVEQPAKFDLVINLKTEGARVHNPGIVASSRRRGDRMRPRNVSTECL
jgi:hypothetical protein